MQICHKLGFDVYNNREDDALKGLTQFFGECSGIHGEAVDLTFGQKAIIGSGGYTPEDVKDVMEIMKSGKWDIEKLITHEYCLDDLACAIEQASKPDEALNVVIRFAKS